MAPPTSGDAAVQKLIIGSIDKMERNMGELHRLLRDLDREVVSGLAELKGLRADVLRIEADHSSGKSKMMTLEKVDREARGALIERVAKLEVRERKTVGLSAGAGAGVAGAVVALERIVQAVLLGG